ncbi:hypothetical protein MIMGU_mgv1a020319mg [Erythranthe guttata]|uniref:Glycosyltransferases n=1 Tax=Erythranthe guttata TaxID=4155 RepID=A0A022R0I7_ERYGU|nr:hypothetical protein MIMGU_mgv1a020319mg [Erythranthe guttata]
MKCLALSDAMGSFSLECHILHLFLFSNICSKIHFLALPFSTAAAPLPERNVSAAGDGSRVVVGRHEILIRSWPHPDPAEFEQRSQYELKRPRIVIAITLTYVQTFQALHLTGVMHTLINVPYDLIWIVDRHKLELKMRLHALRYILIYRRVVREKKLDGIVMFADDSNMHTLELFDEVQKVMKWIGAVSVGILAQLGGPACNSSNHLAQLHTFDTRPFIDRRARYIGEWAVVLPRKLEWGVFVLNLRLFWEDMRDKIEFAEV